MLVELTKKEINNLKSHICLFEKNEKYLAEIEKEIPYLRDKIDYIIEPNVRYQTMVGTISCVSLEKMREMDWNITDIIITSDYFLEAYEILMACGFGNPAKIYYYTNLETKTQLKYKEILKNLPISNQILFRSGPHQKSYVPGMDFADNARAVFEYMLAEKLNQKYRLIWIVKDPAEYEHISSGYENVDFVSWDWEESKDKSLQRKYFEALYLSKIVLFTDAYGFARNCRKDQIRIQLWHGCGFKTRTNFVPCEKRYEYNIVISQLYKEIHKKIYGLRDDQVVITGYPKADWLFHPVTVSRMQMLNIRKAARYIFWLPTFRTAKNQLAELNEKKIDCETGLPIVEKAEQLEEINDILKKKDAILVIKLHPFQDETKICFSELSNIVSLQNEAIVRNGLQINQILGNADALISDYSSVATEYLLLDRPMAFTTDDIESYKAGRGFVFDDIEEYLPGKEITEFEGFKEFINEVTEGIDSSAEKRKRVADKMIQFHDDKSSKRVVEWFLEMIRGHL